MNAAALERSTGLTGEFQEIARAKVQDWSAVCQNFLDRQSKEILRGNPSHEQRESHRVALKWLLRLTRAIHLTTADPDYPDHAVAHELEGRLHQLEESWRMVNNSMTESEADQLIARHFPS